MSHGCLTFSTFAGFVMRSTESGNRFDLNRQEAHNIMSRRFRTALGAFVPGQADSQKDTSLDGASKTDYSGLVGSYE